MNYLVVAVVWRVETVESVGRAVMLEDFGRSMWWKSRFSIHKASTGQNLTDLDEFFMHSLSRGNPQGFWGGFPEVFHRSVAKLLNHFLDFHLKGMVFAALFLDSLDRRDDGRMIAVNVLADLGQGHAGHFTDEVGCEVAGESELFFAACTL